VAFLEPGETVERGFDQGSGAYFFLIKGEVDLNTARLVAGDAARILNEERLTITARQPSELIMVRVEL
jgi:redox-sensitive bicupin YhaK (pirin superfamily)